MKKRHVSILIVLVVVACSLFFFLRTDDAVGYSANDGEQVSIKSSGEKVKYRVKQEKYIEGIYLGDIMHGSMEREKMSEEDKQQFILQIMNDLQDKYEDLHGIIVFLYDRDEGKMGPAYISLDDEGRHTMKKLIKKELGSVGKNIKVKENGVWYFNQKN